MHEALAHLDISGGLRLFIFILSYNEGPYKKGENMVETNYLGYIDYNILYEALCEWYPTLTLKLHDIGVLEYDKTLMASWWYNSSPKIDNIIVYHSYTGSEEREEMIALAVASRGKEEDDLIKEGFRRI